MDHIIPAEFNGTALSIIDHAGQKWLTAEEVGRCLGYNEANVAQGIRNLFNRHLDEFGEQDSRQIDLICRDGKTRLTRIFSGEGCIMLAMFANTPRAKEFRQWAKRVLAGQPPVSAVLPASTADGQLVDKALGMMNDLLGGLRRQVETQGKQIERLTRGLLAAKDAELRYRRQQVATDIQRRIDRVILMEADGMPRDAIVSETGLSFNYVRQIIFRARKNGDLPPEATAQASLDLEGRAS